jgi:hypothetical protein
VVTRCISTPVAAKQAQEQAGYARKLRHSPAVGLDVSAQLMAAHVFAAGAREVHHTVSPYLLELRDRAYAHSELDGEGIQL